MNSRMVRWVLMFNNRHSSGDISNRSSDMSNHWNLKCFFFISSPLQFLHSRFLLHLHKHRHQKQPQKKSTHRRPNWRPYRQFPSTNLPLRLIFTRWRQRQRCCWFRHQTEVSMFGRNAHEWRHLICQRHFPVSLKISAQSGLVTRHVSNGCRNISKVYGDWFSTGRNSELESVVEIQIGVGVVS